MRLTLELLQQAPQSLNPASQRQLLLRGFKIPAIENLGGTNDAYECIDFSDNDLIKVTNFPPLKRLHILLFTNNRISRLDELAFDPLPNLLSVVLTGNKLEKLIDLEPLTKVKTLERLSLLENPVTKVKHYRPYMINKCSKTLRILDFNRIKDKERKAAGLLFAGERGKKLLEEIAPPRVAGKELDQKAAASGDTGRVGPSPEVIERIKRAIAEAETIEEVTRLERALKSGILPEDLKLDKKEEEAPAAAEAKDVEMRPAVVPPPTVVAPPTSVAPAPVVVAPPATTAPAPAADTPAAEAKPKGGDAVTVDDDKEEAAEPAAKKGKTATTTVEEAKDKKDDEDKKDDKDKTDDKDKKDDKQ